MTSGSGSGTEMASSHRQLRLHREVHGRGRHRRGALIRSGTAVRSRRTAPHRGHHHRELLLITLTFGRERERVRVRSAERPTGPPRPPGHVRPGRRRHPRCGTRFGLGVDTQQVRMITGLAHGRPDVAARAPNRRSLPGVRCGDHQEWCEGDRIVALAPTAPIMDLPRRGPRPRGWPAADPGGGTRRSRPTSGGCSPGWSLIDHHRGTSASLHVRLSGWCAVGSNQTPRSGGSGTVIDWNRCGTLSGGRNSQGVQ
jgi:hypothetical protein